METVKKDLDKTDQLVWKLLAVIGSFYLISVLFTESLWGFHFIAIAPTFAKVCTLFTMIIILVIRKNEKVLDTLINFKFNPIQGALVITLFFAFLFHNFNFVNDAYGDALRHKEFLPEEVDSLDEERASKAFTINVLQPKIGEITVLNAVEIISYKTGTQITEVFKWIGTIFGSIFVFFWILFTKRYFKGNKFANHILILGLFSPFLQIFFGHVEIYAPVITLSALTLMSLLLFLQERRKLWGLLMLLGLFFSMKFHFASILLAPACLFAWGIHLRERFAEKWVTWKYMWLLVMLPAILIGVAAYVFVFQDHADPRFLNGNIDTSERLFLPVFSPEAPLDRYNLFSWNHLWDYFNMFFLWSIGGVFILILAFFRRRNVNWHYQGLILVTMTLLFYVGLFFMINPLLSMPIDWDLFTLPAPIFLLFASLLLSQMDQELFARKLIAPILILSLLIIPIVATNSSVDSTSKRLEYLGRYTFKTYWIRSIETLKVGLDMQPESFEERLVANVNHLKPYAVKGHDHEYANLLWRTGQFYRKNGQSEEALKWHLESKAYFKGLKYNRIGIVESYYLLGQFDMALEESKELVKLYYPSEKRALDIALDCAVNARDTAVVLDYGNRLQLMEPNNSYYSETIGRFNTSSKKDSVQ